MCMCVCVCVCFSVSHARTDTHMHTHTHTRARTHTSTHSQTYTHTHARAHTHTHSTKVAAECQLYLEAWSGSSTAHMHYTPMKEWYKSGLWYFFLFSSERIWYGEHKGLIFSLCRKNISQHLTEQCTYTSRHIITHMTRSWSGDGGKEKSKLQPMCKHQNMVIHFLAYYVEKWNNKFFITILRITNSY